MFKPRLRYHKASPSTAFASRTTHTSYSVIGLAERLRRDKEPLLEFQGFKMPKRYFVDMLIARIISRRADWLSFHDEKVTIIASSGTVDAHVLAKLSGSRYFDVIRKLPRQRYR